MSDESYPYITRQRAWGHEIVLNVNSFKTNDWYGLAGHLRRTGGDEAAALDLCENWNVPLRSIIHPGDVVFDVGANEGYTTVLFAKRVGPAGRVVAIEADDRNCELIRKHVALNYLGNVEIINAIVSDRTGECKHFLHEIVQTTDEGPLVETIKLDDLLDRKPTVLKIDIEGYELPALLGAQRILATRPRMEVELHLSLTSGINMTDRFGYRPEAIVELLKSYGYTIWKDGKDITGNPMNEGCVICMPPEKA